MQEATHAGRQEARVISCRQVQMRFTDSTSYKRVPSPLCPPPAVRFSLRVGVTGDWETTTEDARPTVRVRVVPEGPTKSMAYAVPSAFSYLYGNCDCKIKSMLRVKFSIATSGRESRAHVLFY